MLFGCRNMHLSWTTWGLKMPFRPSAHWPANWKSLICKTVLSVILLSMLIILLSILSVIRYLICGNNLNWLLNLNLIYETLDWGKKWPNGLITLVLLMWKWMGLFLKKNHLLRCWGWPSLLNWIGALTLSQLINIISISIGVLICSFFWGWFVSL